MSEYAKFQKIPLKVMLDILSSLYNSGANFVDIIGMPDKEQDSIGISVKEEYMATEEEMENEEEIDYEITNVPPPDFYETNIIETPLSEEDLNTLT